MTDSTGSAAIDPVTFEVVKHRLWQINDEQGIAIKIVDITDVCQHPFLNQ